MEADTPVETDAGNTAPVMQLDDGVELLGKYKGSGLQEAPYLLRRRDGQVVQVSRLLYLIAGCLDSTRYPEPEERAADEVASRVSASFGQEVTPENVVYLVDKKLRPAGLIVEPNGEASGRSTTRSNPLLALRLRLPVVPADAHRRVTQAFEFLFAPAWIVATLVGLVIADVWLVLEQWGNLSVGLRQIVFEPHLFLVMTGLIILAGMFHEVGHAAAARYGGAVPGRMGVGVYLVWPVFFTDLTDAYRLDRRGRLRTDLGGVYFNVVSMVVVAMAAASTGYRPLLVFLVILHVETARQFLPFVRLDGYYVVSDLAGVPNLFTYIQPVMVTLLRRGDPEAQRTARAKLAELNPRARRLVTGWVYLTAPVLAINAVVLLFVAPRLAGAFWASAGLQLQAMTSGGIPVISFLNGLLALALLALPFVGLSYVIVRVAARILRNMSTWWQARPLATATVSVAAVTLVALQVAVEWPDTFADAMKKAQVAQAIDESYAGDDYGGEQLALPTTPAAEAASVPPSEDMSTTDAGDTPPTTSDDGAATTTGSSGARTTTQSGSSGTTAKPGGRPAASGDGTSDGETKAAGSSTTSSTSSTASTAAGGAGAASSSAGSRPATQEVPRGPAQPQTTTPAPQRPASTTTTTRPPNMLEDILDILF